MASSSFLSFSRDPRLHTHLSQELLTFSGCAELSIAPGLLLHIQTLDYTPLHPRAEFGEFPWMVAIVLEAVIDGQTVKDYKCAGSILAPNVVLTAAHSVYNLEAHLLLARAGEWDMQSEDEETPHQDARIKEIIYHKNYVKEMLHNDVALLILETPYFWGRNV